MALFKVNRTILKFCLAALFICSFQAHSSEVIEGWIENENIAFAATIGLAPPSSSIFRMRFAIKIELTNNDTKALVGPVRFVFKSLSSWGWGLKNPEGKMAGYEYVTIIPEEAELTIGESSIYSFDIVLLSLLTLEGTSPPSGELAAESGVYTEYTGLLTVDIISPETLLTVGASPVQVSGTINNAQAELTLNGVPINHQNGDFTAQVELKEGFNTVIARATTMSGEQTTDSIVISLDLTPPYLTIESHLQGQEVYSDSITVTGLINDIVRGTVESEQAAVQVNGIPALISNRSYAAHNIPLTEGENTITVTGVDQAGNSASIERQIIYKVVSGSKLELVAGQRQEAEVGSQLPEALQVKLVNNQGLGLADETVIFRVIQGAGQVGLDTPSVGRAVIITTNSEGIAETFFQLGYRSGVANHKVKAKVVGYENEIIFNATALSKAASTINVNSGNNQRGTIAQLLPAPFIVTVTDDEGNAVKGAAVLFETTVGEGLFNNNLTAFETTTDSDGRATAQFILGALEGIDVQRVQATLISATGVNTSTLSFAATAFKSGLAGNTSVVGVVLDNQDAPIPGVTMRIENTDRLAVTDAQGQFEILQAPVGPIHIIADGSTATVPGEFPSLSYHLVTVSGVENPMSSPIYMVKLDTTNGVFAGLEDVVLTLEDYPGFKLEIAKDSVTFPDGTRQGIVSATSVNTSKVPMTPSNGLQPEFVLTIQPAGATFDPPARLTLPNVSGVQAGSQIEMYSFDHDLEEYVVIGLGTISDDGMRLASNAGVGVIKAGWHSAPPPPRLKHKNKSGKKCTYSCETCFSCDADCNCIEDIGIDSSPGDCKGTTCTGGSFANPNDVPREVGEFIGDCKKPGCSGDNKDTPHMTFENDDTDISEKDKRCATCQDGEKIEDPEKVDSKCGEGDKEACYTCKDGECDNHCEADKDREVTNIGIPPQVIDFFTIVTKASEKFKSVSPIAVSIDVSGGGTLDQGQACCDECTEETSQPVNEKKWSVNVSINAAAKVDAGVPIPSYENYQGDSRLIIKATAGLTGVFTGKAFPKYEFSEKLECENEEPCHDFSAQVAVGGDVYLGGDVVAAHQEWDNYTIGVDCNFKNSGKRKLAKYSICWKKIVGISGVIKGGSRVDLGFSSATNTCTGPTSCSFNISPIEVYFEVGVTLNLILIDWDYIWKPEPFVLRDKSSHSCL
ncbi:MAG: hypothetical protein MJK12_16925 [Colwellia sp.]|nr:hypothetical protein [Colwellia sp.]